MKRGMKKGSKCIRNKKARGGVHRCAKYRK